MYLIETNEIVQGNNREVVERWEVWFMTPFGVTPDLSQAKDICEKIDMLPAMNVIPIPVVISKTMYEVNGGIR